MQLELPLQTIFIIPTHHPLRVTPTNSSQSDNPPQTSQIIVKYSDLINGHLRSNTETLSKIPFYLSLSQSILIVYKQEQS